MKIKKIAFQCLCCGQLSARFVLLLFSSTQAPSGPGCFVELMDRAVESLPAVNSAFPCDERHTNTHMLMCTILESRKILHAETLAQIQHADKRRQGNTRINLTSWGHPGDGPGRDSGEHSGEGQGPECANGVVWVSRETA